MRQVIVNEDTIIELKDLYIVLSGKTSKEEQKDIEQIKKQIELFELFKNQNPRYFEEVIPLKDTKEKLYTSDIIANSKFNIFRVF
ncbi:MAG: hypothetical protein ACFE94_13125 [Candidatus Hodarchaeota archaeon]